MLEHNLNLFTINKIMSLVLVSDEILHGIIFEKWLFSEPCFQNLIDFQNSLKLMFSFKKSKVFNILTKIFNEI